MVHKLKEFASTDWVLTGDSYRLDMNRRRFSRKLAKVVVMEVTQGYRQEVECGVRVSANDRHIVLLSNIKFNGEVWWY